MKTRSILFIVGLFILLVSAIPKNKHYWMEEFTVDMATLSEDSVTYYVSAKNSRSYPEIYYSTNSLDTVGVDAEIQVRHSIKGGDGARFFEVDGTKFPIVLLEPNDTAQVISDVSRTGVFSVTVVKNESTSGTVNVFFQLTQ